MKTNDEIVNINSYLARELWMDFEVYKLNAGEIISYNEKEYLGIEEFRKHCEDAIEDIPLLAKHIEETMR